VASSGLESYFKHGFQGTMTFVQQSLASYARSSLPFVSDAHDVVHRSESDDMSDTLSTLSSIDDLYHTMTLNHVTRRASKAQGVALLTLYAKSFSKPESRMASLVSQFKLMVRKEQVQGHLPICWGILTAALGLTLERSQYLHLFLHARSLLSASVRLNEIGPYNAQQLLLHDVRPIIAIEHEKCKDLRTGVLFNIDEIIDGPANTWPLGEILAARHDLQHSRIFNS